MSLWSAGSNARGQLAHGDNEDAHKLEPALFEIAGKEQMTPPSSIVQIACGANHTLALVESNSERSIWGVGDNSRGQLGIAQNAQEFYAFRRLNLGAVLQNRDEEGTETVEMIQAAWETSFAVLRSAKRDRIISFGSNDFGLLGGPSISNTLETACEVSFDYVGISKPEEDLHLRVTHFRSGPRHALAVIRDEVSGEWRDTLIGWGACRHHELEIRDPQKESKPPSKESRSISHPITIGTWKFPQEVIDIAVGQQHALVLLNDGQIIMLGSNSKSQLPSGTDLEASSRLDGGIRRVYCSWNNSFLASGSLNTSSISCLWSYGRNLHGQLGRDEEAATPSNHIGLLTQLDIQGAVCGSEHSLIRCKTHLEDTSQLWGWGWNEHGNLALGHTNDVKLPTQINLPCHGDCVEKTKDSSCHNCRRYIKEIWAGCGTSWVFISSPTGV